MSLSGRPCVYVHGATIPAGHAAPEAPVPCLAVRDSRGAGHACTAFLHYKGRVDKPCSSFTLTVSPAQTNASQDLFRVRRARLAFS